MFGNVNFMKRSSLDECIDKVASDLKNMEPTDPSFETVSKNLKILIEARDSEKSGKINVNTLLIVGGNLLGIIAVLGFESGGHVLTSKAANFIMKPHI